MIQNLVLKDLVIDWNCSVIRVSGGKQRGIGHWMLVSGWGVGVELGVACLGNGNVVFDEERDCIRFQVAMVHWRKED